MSYWSTFAFVAIAHLLAVMSPGPDLAMVTRQTLAHGRAAGIWTALGIGAGVTFHMAWAMFGMGWVIERFPPFLEILRLAGAAFLIWIGSQAIRARPLDPGDIDPLRAAAGGRARNFFIGVATNILNPKALMFFMALCSAVVTTATPFWLRLGLSAWMIVSTGGWFSLVAVTLGHPAVRARVIGNAHWIDRAMGLILLVLGAAMLASGLLPKR
jgi:threonine/homoserine/homoserine lactone efflux protein